MTISLNQIGKRYKDTWVFKNVNYHFEAGKKYALLGANGSGKSTLLRIIGSLQAPSRGSVTYQTDQHPIADEKIFQYVSYCAPGMELPEEMTLQEFLQFHFSFKPMLPGWSRSKILEELQMQPVKNRYLHEFSSGMKQRVKLLQAIFSTTPLLLLDEPCSNLDTEGVKKYQQWLQQHAANRLVIIASNDAREYEQTDASFSIEDFH